MKKTIGVILLALLCWAIPIKLLAQTADLKPQIEIKTQSDYTSDSIVIKDNAIQKPSIPKVASKLSKSSAQKSTFNPSKTFDGRNYSKEEVQQLIRDYSAQYGISADLPLRIANCESGFNQFAKNKSSSASGVYQWLSSSWTNQPAAQANTVSVFDADKNVSAAVWLIAHNQTSPWNASKSCWSQ